MSPHGHRKGDEALFQHWRVGQPSSPPPQSRPQSPDGLPPACRPGFRKRLTDLRSEMVERAMSMLTAASLEAVKTLVSLQDTSHPAAVRRRTLDHRVGAQATRGNRAGRADLGSGRTGA
jgi:hypothetical protein